jgi:hypothetical protein
MITRFVKTVGLLGALGVFTLSAADMPFARATVPFEFAAGGSMMPAGDYIIDLPDFTGVVVLHGPQSASVVLLTTASETTSASGSKLLFERHDGMAYLTGVQGPDKSVKVPVARIVKVATAALR